jgi:anion transporter
MAHSKRGTGPVIVCLALIAASLLVLFQPLSVGENDALALCILVISLWASGVIPESVTALLFFTLAMWFHIAPASVIFSGFQSGALWLIVGGLIVGAAIKSTGLGERIARRLSRAFGDSYGGVIMGVVLVGTALGFVMPSSLGRAVLLMPIALSLADKYGFAPGRAGRTGIVLAAALGSHVATFAVLPANVPNMVFAGAAEMAYGYVPSYGRYLLLHFPVLGAVKTLFLIGLIVWLWPDRPVPLRHEDSPPLTRAQIWLSIILVVALCLWASDFWHHISPAWISMAAAVLLLLPKIGLIDRATLNRDINFTSLFYIGGVLGMGALVSQSGLGRDLGQVLTKILPLAPNQNMLNFADLALIGSVIALLTTVTGVPAVLTPLAGGLANATGLPLETVLMSEVLGFSNPILPYESPPLVVAMQLGQEPMKQAIKLCLWLGAITLLLLFPLDYLWWRLLGWI